MRVVKIGVWLFDPYEVPDFTRPPDSVHWVEEGDAFTWIPGDGSKRAAVRKIADVPAPADEPDVIVRIAN